VRADTTVYAHTTPDLHDDNRADHDALCSRSKSTAHPAHAHLTSRPSYSSPGHVVIGLLPSVSPSRRPGKRRASTTTRLAAQPDPACLQPQVPLVVSPVRSSTYPRILAEHHSRSLLCSIPRTPRQSSRAPAHNQPAPCQAVPHQRHRPRSPSHVRLSGYSPTQPTLLTPASRKQFLG
jgi:hypothetical protein